MTIAELTNKMKNMYEGGAATLEQSMMVRLFGIIYAAELKNLAVIRSTKLPQMPPVKIPTLPSYAKA